MKRNRKQEEKQETGSNAKENRNSGTVRRRGP